MAGAPADPAAAGAAPVLQTARLSLHRLQEPRDAAFILELVNQPSWLAFIGDKQVHSLADARRYLRDGPLAMYDRLGFGLYRMARRDDPAQPIGLCGLVKRDTLPEVDIGFALLDRHAGQGLAREAAAAVLAHARGPLGLERVLAIVSPGNQRSIRLLQAIGLHFERVVQLAPDAAPVQLFST